MHNIGVSCIVHGSNYIMSLLGICPTKRVGYRSHIVIQANCLTRVFYTFRRVQVTQFVIVKKRVFVSHVLMHIATDEISGWAMWTRQRKVYFEHKIVRRLWGGVPLSSLPKQRL